MEISPILPALQQADRQIEKKIEASPIVALPARLAILALSILRLLVAVMQLFACVIGLIGLLGSSQSRMWVEKSAMDLSDSLLRVVKSVAKVFQGTLVSFMELTLLALYYAARPLRLTPKTLSPSSVV